MTDFHITGSEDFFQFDPTLEEDLTGLGLGDLDLDWSDSPVPSGSTAPHPDVASSYESIQPATVVPVVAASAEEIGSVKVTQDVMAAPIVTPRPPPFVCGQSGSTTCSPSRNPVLYDAQRANSAQKMPPKISVKRAVKENQSKKSLRGRASASVPAMNWSPSKVTIPSIPPGQKIKPAGKQTAKPGPFPINTLKTPVRGPIECATNRAMHCFPSPATNSSVSNEKPQWKDKKFVGCVPQSTPNLGVVSGAQEGRHTLGQAPTPDQIVSSKVEDASKVKAALTARERRAHRKERLQGKKKARKNKKNNVHNQPNNQLQQNQSSSTDEVTAIANKLMQGASGLFLTGDTSFGRHSMSVPDDVLSAVAGMGCGTTASKNRSPPVRPSPSVMAAPSVPDVVTSSATSSVSNTLPSESSVPKNQETEFSRTTFTTVGVSAKQPKTKKVKTKKTTSSPSGSSCSSLFSASAPIDEEEERLLASAHLPEGTDAESRRQRRLIRNRLSAALHRKRKRETLDNQKKMIEERDDAISDLRDKLDRVSVKCANLEKDLAAVTRYYGESIIRSILEAARSGKALVRSAALPESPPHLVNLSTSGSDQSTCSDHEDSCTTSSASPPMSPAHYGSNSDEHLERDRHQQHSVAREATPSPSPSEEVGTKKNGKKRGVSIGLYPAIATMAVCGLLGCSVPPRALQHPKVQEAMNSSPLVVTSSSDQQEQPERGRRRLQTVDESASVDVDVDSKTALSKWSEPNLDMEQLLRLLDDGSGKGRRVDSSSSSSRPWLISPIENFPSLWSVDERSGTPWIARQSHQLFDFRTGESSSRTTENTRGEAASRSSTSSPAVSAVVPIPLRLDSDEQYPVRLPTSHASTVTTLTRSDGKPPSTPTRASLRGAVLRNWRKEGKDDGGNDDDWIDYDTFDEPRHSNEQHQQEADRSSASGSDTVNGDSEVVAGPSFMFCPDASASLSPEFLDLTGLGTTGPGGVFTTPSGEDQNVGGEPDDPFRNDGDITQELLYEAVKTLSGSDSAGAEFVDGAYDGSDNARNEESSKALVPAYFDYYRKKFFSFPTSEPPSSSRFPRSDTPIVKPVTSGDDPFMTILLPSSAIAGGFSSSFFFENSDEQENQPFIELGCHVLSARLVDGLSFVGDTRGNDFASA